MVAADDGGGGGIAAARTAGSRRLVLCVMLDIVPGDKLFVKCAARTARRPRTASLLTASATRALACAHSRARAPHARRAHDVVWLTPSCLFRYDATTPCRLRQQAAAAEAAAACGEGEPRHQRLFDPLARVRALATVTLTATPIATVNEPSASAARPHASMFPVQRASERDEPHASMFPVQRASERASETNTHKHTLTRGTCARSEPITNRESRRRLLVRRYAYDAVANLATPAPRGALVCFIAN